MNNLQQLTLFLTFVVGGVILEALIVRIFYSVTNKQLYKLHFSYARFLFMLLFPALSVAMLIYLQGLPVLGIFLLFTLVGALLEWCIGYAYHHIVGQRLWTYHRLSLNGYTSLLTLPLWGCAGVLFWLIAKVF